MKKCSQCNETDESKFRKSPRSEDGLSNSCAKCIDAAKSAKLSKVRQRVYKEAYFFDTAALFNSFTTLSPDGTYIADKEKFEKIILERFNQVLKPIKTFIEKEDTESLKRVKRDIMVDRAMGYLQEYMRINNNG